MEFAEFNHYCNTSEVMNQHNIVISINKKQYLQMIASAYLLITLDKDTVEDSLDDVHYVAKVFLIHSQ